MNPEIKARWIAELRSGEYVQGNSFLKRAVDGQVQHCCLGVLCELAVQDGLAESVPDEGDENVHRFGWGALHLGGHSVSVLPEGVSEWAGISSTGRFVLSSGERTSLSYLNDAEHRSFEDIANVIEEHF